MSDQTHVRTWRMSVFTRLGSLGLFGLAVAIVLTSDDPNRPGAGTLEGAVVGFVLIDAVLSAFLQPKLRADQRGLTVVNLFLNYRIPWSMVKSVQADNRVVIDTPVRRVRVWAVQGAHLMGNETYVSRPQRVRDEVIALRASNFAADSVPLEQTLLWRSHALAAAVVALISVLN